MSRKSSTDDYRFKLCMFSKNGDLWISGSTPLFFQTLQVPMPIQRFAPTSPQNPLLQEIDDYHQKVSTMMRILVHSFP